LLVDVKAARRVKHGTCIIHIFTAIVQCVIGSAFAISLAIRMLSSEVRVCARLQIVLPVGYRACRMPLSKSVKGDLTFT
jgi:hypothetical protein